MQVQMFTTKHDQMQYEAIETKHFFRITADLKAAYRASRNESHPERYWLARMEDVTLFGSELVVLEMHTDSNRVRRLCKAAIKKYKIDLDWLPDIREGDDGEPVDTSTAAHKERELFEALYLRDAENDLVDVVDRLSEPGLPRSERAALTKKRRMHEFELVWLSSVAYCGKQQIECRKILQKHNIDPEKARKLHKV